DPARHPLLRLRPGWGPRRLGRGLVGSASGVPDHSGHAGHRRGGRGQAKGDEVGPERNAQAAQPVSTPVAEAHRGSRGFRLALPMTWLDVDLDPETRHESILRLVAERAARTAAAGGSERVAAVIEEAATVAQRHGAVLAAMFADVLDERPVSA